LPQGSPRDPVLGELVIKSGRSTGLDQGRVQAVNTTITINYGCGSARFVQIVIVFDAISAFAAGGDSGSGVLSKNTHEPVGIFFARNPIGWNAVAPLPITLQQLGLQLF
jgi:hypothetical protein